MSEQTVYGAATDAKARTKVRTLHLQKWKAEGHKWAMLTAYDYSTARIFDDAGIPVLLVGDSAANVVFGYDTTVPVTIDELIPLVRGVVRGAPHALVVADLPFGSYESGPAQALSTATRFLKETGAHAVKLEGGERVVDQIAAISTAGIPVMAHIGFTPQSVNGLGGFRVQGRGDGPVAASFRVEVPDLTRTAGRGRAADARDRIVRIIDGRYIVGAHGARLMPVWGEDLARLEIGNPDAERSAQIIIGRLADYVSSLQKPASK